MKYSPFLKSQKGKKNVLLIYAPLYKGLPGRDEVMGYSKLTYEDYIKNPCVWNIVPPKWVAELSEKGYKVAQIGTKKISNIMGFYSIPDFMYNNRFSGEETILRFNEFVKKVER